MYPENMARINKSCHVVHWKRGRAERPYGVTDHSLFVSAYPGDARLGKGLLVNLHQAR